MRRSTGAAAAVRRCCWPASPRWPPARARPRPARPDRLDGGSTPASRPRPRRRRSRSAAAGRGPEPEPRPRPRRAATGWGSEPEAAPELGRGAAGHGADRLRRLRRPGRVRARRAGRRLLGQLRGRGGAGRLRRAGDGARGSPAAGAAATTRPTTTPGRPPSPGRVGRAAAVGVRVPVVAVGRVRRQLRGILDVRGRRAGPAAVPGVDRRRARARSRIVLELAHTWP